MILQLFFCCFKLVGFRSFSIGLFRLTSQCLFFWFLELTSKCSGTVTEKFVTRTLTSVPEIILVCKIWLYSSCIALGLYLFCLLWDRIHSFYRFQTFFSDMKHLNVLNRWMGLHQLLLKFHLTSFLSLPCIWGTCSSHGFE